MADTTHAVFLSYASQDAEAARRIAEALRALVPEAFLKAHWTRLPAGDVTPEFIERLHALLRTARM